MHFADRRAEPLMPRGGLGSPGRRWMSRFWLPLRIVRGHPRLFAGMAVSAIKADYHTNRAARGSLRYGYVRRSA
ncbi:MAG: hypothetical protein CR217_13845 [Beijerinckiaceae bacterium]|nr:MAG: hypothetical protein CR217_13845 [Beijerinckiaceae bacterium]